MNEDPRYLGGAYWEQPGSGIRVRIVPLLSEGDVWILECDPLEHGAMPAAMWKRGDKYPDKFTQAEVIDNLSGWTYLGDFSKYVTNYFHDLYRSEITR